MVMIGLSSSGAVMMEEAYEAEGRQISVVIRRRPYMAPSQGYQIWPSGLLAEFIEGSAPRLYTFILAN